MSIYGSLISENKELDTNFSIDTFLESFKNFSLSFHDIDRIFIECDAFCDCINESNNEVILEFSMKTVWDKIKQVLKTIWEKVKELGNKIKSLFKNKEAERVSKEFDEMKKKYNDLEKESSVKAKSKKEAENEIERLKNEIKDLKEQMKQKDELHKDEMDIERQTNRNLSNSNEEKDKLIQAQKDLQKLEFDKIIADLMSNPIIYFSPKMLFKYYQLNLDNYINSLDDITAGDSLKRYMNKIKDDNEVIKIFNNIFQDDVMKLSKDNNNFKWGGLDHYELNDFINKKLKEKVKSGEIYDPKEFMEFDFTFSNATTSLNELLNNTQKIIGKLTQTVERLSRINIDNWEQMRTKEFRGEKSDYMNQPEVIKNIIDDTKRVIEVLTTVTRVTGVAIKFEGLKSGACKTTLSSLKSVVASMEKFGLSL